MFAAIDLTAFQPLVESLLNSLASGDGWVAGIGALALLVVQRLGGAKVDVWATVKGFLSKFAVWKKTNVYNLPLDLSAHEVEVLQKVVEEILKARGEVVQAVDAVKAEKRDGLLKRIFGDKPAA